MVTDVNKDLKNWSLWSQDRWCEYSRILLVHQVLGHLLIEEAREKVVLSRALGTHGLSLHFCHGGQRRGISLYNLSYTKCFDKPHSHWVIQLISSEVSFKNVFSCHLKENRLNFEPARSSQLYSVNEKVCYF